MRLEGGRARKAQTYPRELCKAICVGLQEQIKADAAGQFLPMESSNEEATSRELMGTAKEIPEKYKTVEEPDEGLVETAWDDVSGAELDPNQVKKARAEEIDYIHMMKLYEKVTIDDCYKKTGKTPISVRWIDISKGDAQSPNNRSRLVAREINTYKRDDLFAATPPIEALKMIISMAATANRGEVIMVNDIRRAFFHAKVTRDVYVQLPPEDVDSNEERMCGKLLFSMYGTRDAAQSRHQEYTQQLLDAGFQ